jgi:hypothetical protein
MAGMLLLLGFLFNGNGGGWMGRPSEGLAADNLHLVLGVCEGRAVIDLSCGRVFLFSLFFRFCFFPSPSLALLWAQ